MCMYIHTVRECKHFLYSTSDVSKHELIQKQMCIYIQSESANTPFIVHQMYLNMNQEQNLMCVSTVSARVNAHVRVNAHPQSASITHKHPPPPSIEGWIHTGFRTK